MAGQQKRGFRLPWGAAGTPDGGSAAATLDPESNESTTGEVRDELGEGPFGLADATPPMTTDAVPAAPDVPETTAEAAMIETQSPTPTAAQEAAPAAQAASGAAQPASPGAWPDSDRAGAPKHAPDRPAIRVESAAPIPRRDNPLVAGLIKAMREAAVASREETSSRLQAEASTRIETIKGRATSEVAELKKRADEDVAGIREWSKGEMARIKQATDDRIEARKGDLEGETERHAAGVKRLVDDVETVVLQFEEDMDRFFERLLAETDPARLAALAEQAPEPPDLSGEGPTALDMMATAEDPRATMEWADLDQAGADHAVDEQPANGLEASAAAEAEAAATEGLDMTGAEEWPSTVMAAANRHNDATPSDDEADSPERTRLLVSGLASVAGISAFKGALGQLPGVHAVSVSSGEPGTFVFTLHHEPDLDLASAVTGIADFSARITDATADGVSVVAHEPA
jgi:hypothetical protein